MNKTQKIKDGEVTQMINFASNLILDFEKDSDRRISAICRALTGLNMLVILFNMLHVFKISTALYPTLIVSAVILLLPTLFYDIFLYEIYQFAISKICNVLGMQTG